ncbi:C2 calcium-dependent membrane targeting [Cynara cardunculus var. scolymus]|uniref:C2 calcium-dependent membrane targeting n=1 Tax=Cynara cardunculus var. scolymus TaxID=59895 RepID=A0A118K4P6_CYNCS|nr:C2 calcium-dependent membrane targeting [Cynara cardunculus var. scolymus]
MAEDNPIGILRITVKRGIGLAIRDMKTSDPYAVIKMGKQKWKTRVIENDVYPEWNEEFSIPIHDPDVLIKLTQLRKNLPSGTILKKIPPGRANCLSEESHITWENGKVIQRMFLRLQNVECGEVELEFNGFDEPGASST